MTLSRTQLLQARLNVLAARLRKHPGSGPTRNAIYATLAEIPEGETLHFGAVTVSRGLTIREIDALCNAYYAVMMEDVVADAEVVGAEEWMDPPDEDEEDPLLVLVEDGVYEPD